MAGTITDFWRIVKPQTPRDLYTYNAEVDELGNNAWYAKLLSGSTSRFARYNQYRMMDNDVFVARALDTIAEEMTPENTTANLPFIIDYQSEITATVPDHVVVLIRAALRHWCSIQKIDDRKFQIARTLIKYGDCFFKKKSDLQPWEFVEPSTVAGMVLDKRSNKPLYYQIGETSKGRLAPVNNTTNLIPVQGMVHFSLSSDLGESFPFGESILQPTIKAYRHMTLLEDSVVIYQIVRAPERRVFFIDVGNMPPQRAKAYLESVKRDVNQKRVPTEKNGREFVDGIPDPMSLTEDFYIATTANGRGSRVETLPGGQLEGATTTLEYFKAKFLEGLRIPTSYMSASKETAAQLNDGKVGVAYIEELRFTKFVKRLQGSLERVFDKQFKDYLKSVDIRVDLDLFKLRLPDPQNFALYKQAAIDAELINTFGTIAEKDYISKRFALKRYLGWSEEDIQLNEQLLKEEQGIPEHGIEGGLTDIRMVYDKAWQENRPDIHVDEQLYTYGANTEAGDKNEDDNESPETMGEEPPDTETSGEEPEAESSSSEEPEAEDLTPVAGGGEEEKIG